MDRPNVASPHNVSPFSTLTMYVATAVLAVVAFTCHLVNLASCQCTVLAKSAYCSRMKLPFIPEGIPADIEDLNLISNKFDNTELQRSNFTIFRFLRNLYLANCGIKKIQPDTFRDLIRLRILDLSKNLISVLPNYVFRGLHLNHLFLTSNLGLTFSSKAFADSTVKGLHLKNCSIKHISINVIQSINQSLQLLALDRNLIKKLSFDWIYTLRRLRHLSVNDNPFHCNCELKWLHTLYTKRPTLFAKRTPSCTTPSRNRNVAFNNLYNDDFWCDLPVFSAVNVDVGLDSANLLCEAKGDPTPTIIWKTPFNTFHVYKPSKNNARYSNTGYINITQTVGKTREIYVCIASTPAGNVTVNVTVTWPPINVVEMLPLRKNAVGINMSTISPTISSSLLPLSSSLSLKSYFSTPKHFVTSRNTTNASSSLDSQTTTTKTTSSLRSIKILRPKIIIAHDRQRDGISYNFESAQIHSSPSKQYNTRETLDESAAAANVSFTIAQLICAVVGTFLITLILSLVLFHLYHRSRTTLPFSNEQTRQKTPENVYVTSDIDEQMLKMMSNNQHNQMRELSG